MYDGDLNLYCDFFRLLDYCTIVFYKSSILNLNMHFAYFIKWSIFGELPARLDILQTSQLIKLMSQLIHKINQDLLAILLHYNFQNSIKELTPGPSLGEVSESTEGRFDSEDKFTTTKDFKLRVDRDNDNNEDVEISCCPRIRFEIKTKSKSQAPRSTLLGKNITSNLWLKL